MKLSDDKELDDLYQDLLINVTGFFRDRHPYKTIEETVIPSIIEKNKNYVTFEAASGEEALDLLKKQPVDLVLLDLKMPGLNGVKTLREIRKTEKTLPVYFVTAFHTEFFEELQQLSSEGVDFEIMRKPIESDQLIEVVAAMLPRK